MKPWVLFLLLAGFLLAMGATNISCGSGEEFEPIVCESDFDCPNGQICSVNQNCVDPF